MRVKTIKHAEFEILKYILTGRGTNLADCRGLTDLGKHLGVEYSEDGRRPVPVEEAKDRVAQRRWQTANKNIRDHLIKVICRYTDGLPDEHINKDWGMEELESMSKRAHRGELI